MNASILTELWQVGGRGGGRGGRDPAFGCAHSESYGEGCRFVCPREPPLHMADALTQTSINPGSSPLTGKTLSGGRDSRGGEVKRGKLRDQRTGKDLEMMSSEGWVKELGGGGGCLI